MQLLISRQPHLTLFAPSNQQVSNQFSGINALCLKFQGHFLFSCLYLYILLSGPLDRPTPLTNFQVVLFAVAGVDEATRRAHYTLQGVLGKEQRQTLEKAQMKLYSHCFLT